MLQLFTFSCSDHVAPHLALQNCGEMSVCVKNVGGANHSEKKLEKGQVGQTGRQMQCDCVVRCTKKGQRNVADNMFQRVGLHRPISRWKSRGQTWSLGLGLTFSKLISPFLIHSLSEGHGFPTWDMFVETLIPFTGHKDTQKSGFCLEEQSHVIIWGTVGDFPAYRSCSQRRGSSKKL